MIHSKKNIAWLSNSFLVILLLLNCSYGFSATTFPYNLNKPDKKFELPEVLNEISGLTDISNTRIACVQDELGVVFIYDFIKGEIVAKHSFDTPGDFEGMTYTGKSLYILRSDGRLTEWKNFDAQTGAGSKVHQQLSLSTTNNEGLCYDSKYNRLLIAAKSKPIDKSEKLERYVYEYNITEGKLQNKPLYSLNTDDLTEKAASLNIHNKDKTPKGKQKLLNFRPSSLAVHPQTDQIYIISAVDKMLVILDRNGKIEHLELLPENLFAKAEGITFLIDGTMIITNEAAGKSPTLLVYKTTGGRD